MYFRLAKILLILPVLGIVLVTPSTLFPFIVGKYVIFRASVDLALVFVLVGLIRSGETETSQYEKRFLSVVKHPLSIAFGVFTLVFVLAGFFGIDPAMSFWSSFERGEGGFQMIHLFLYFLLLLTLFKEEADWKKLFTWVLVGAVLMSVYGFLASLDVSGFLGSRFSAPDYRFQGSIGNPAYVAAYLIFALFFSLYLLFSKKDNSKFKISSPNSLSLLGLMALFLVVFLLAATRGAFIGLMAAIFSALLFLAYSVKKWRKWLIIVGVILLTFVSIMVYFKDTPFVKSIPGSRVFDISIFTKTFQDRMIIWKTAWNGFKDRPWLGFGPESFTYIFSRYFNTDYFKPAEGFGSWFDRAHSIYLDYLTEAGILGLVSYLSIFAVFYWQLFKSKVALGLPVIIRALMFAIPIAYLVQGIVLFDVLAIQLYLFLFFAFSVYKFTSSPKINV